MDKITSIEQLKELILSIRNLHRGFVTNFYLDEEKHAAWIRTGEFLFDKYDDTVFLLFDHYAPDNEKYFTNMYYISISEDAMLARLKEYPEKYIYDLYVLDIVGRDAMCLPLVEKLKPMRGHNDATLVRMNRVGEIEAGTPSRTNDSLRKLKSKCSFAYAQQLHAIKANTEQTAQMYPSEIGRIVW